MPTRRNPYANLPILRKGHVHEKSKSAKRAELKQSLEDEIDEYFSDSEEEGTSFRPTNEGGSETTFYC